MAERRKHKISISDLQRKIHQELEEAGGEQLVDLANMFYKDADGVRRMEADIRVLLELGLASLELPGAVDSSIVIQLSRRPSRLSVHADLADRGNGWRGADRSRGVVGRSQLVGGSR